MYFMGTPGSMIFPVAQHSLRPGFRHVVERAMPESTRLFGLPQISVCYGDIGGFALRAARPNPLTSCAALSEREDAMDPSKYEKSVDNRCAALVSREPRAPRARQNRKSCTINRLPLISFLTRARGAQVSRAARDL